VSQDIANAPLYPNYAMFDIPLSDMYSENVEKLHSLGLIRMMSWDWLVGLDFDVVLNGLWDPYK
jgi:hypothetical protein